MQLGAVGDLYGRRDRTAAKNPTCLQTGSSVPGFVIHSKSRRIQTVNTLLKSRVKREFEARFCEEVGVN